MKKNILHQPIVKEKQNESFKKRHITKYPGVKYRTAKRIGFPGTEKVYYIIYKIAGRLFEEKVGRQYADSMTPEKAARIRGLKIECNLEPRRNTLKRTKQGTARIRKLKNEFRKTKDPVVVLETLRVAHNATLPPPKWAFDILSRAITLYMDGTTDSLDHALGLNRRAGEKATDNANHEAKTPRPCQAEK